MFKHIRPVWEEINLDNLAYNIKQIKKISRCKEIMAVVKADAYGHGSIDVVPELLENGADSLAVAVISEAIELRKSGIEAPILILGFTSPAHFSELLKYDLEQSSFSYEYTELLSEEAGKNFKKAKIHICVDTGMGRIGFLPNEESIEQVYKISKLPNIKIEGIFSHFSTADETDKSYSIEQMKKFNAFCEKLSELGVSLGKKHIGNSAAIMDIPDAHFDAVRPGIVLYGYYPSNEVDKNQIELKPVMQLKTNIVHLKKVPKNFSVGYGRNFITKKESVIATLPVGYADGYTRALNGKAKVIVKKEFAAVVGKICMDQCMIDVSHIKNVSVGDEVILIGNTGDKKFDADDMAEALGTINYEIVCMIGRRVPRVYIKDDMVVKVRNYV
ncbi:alanine racemase [Clostridium grantii]|uniref:Alanine racemase n=1 Tax=Clostridium grantii DSM 8605 TaxID=1121316 RepID=A0A1M5U4U2_9CLOT|nr:alanine racemase [Clostridium grantii]SHH57876.1 alanine racemase [Clostridium grantii DSM 8605]